MIFSGPLGREIPFPHPPNINIFCLFLDVFLHFLSAKAISPYTTFLEKTLFSLLMLYMYYMYCMKWSCPIHRRGCGQLPDLYSQHVLVDSLVKVMQHLSVENGSLQHLYKYTVLCMWICLHTWFWSKLYINTPGNVINYRIHHHHQQQK